MNYPKTDWSRMISDLNRDGLTLVDIGRKVGLAKGSVGDLAKGRSKEPSGYAACRLLNLHGGRYGKGRFLLEAMPKT